MNENIPITVEVPKADVWLRNDYRDIVHRLGEVHMVRACAHQHDDDFVPMYDYQTLEQHMQKAESLRSELDRAWGEVDKLVKQLGDLTMLRKQDELVHGNIMGRIAVNLFGQQNNVTDEECVAETARLGYGRTALMQRVKRLENDLMESLNALGKIVTMADRAIGCSPSEQDDYLADISDTARKVAMRGRAPPLGEIANRPCTCHPDDNPPVPCPKKYALSECRKAALGGEGK